MTEKKTLEEAATLTINTHDNGMDGSLTINAADEAELVQIIKRAGLNNIAGTANGPATLAITSPDGKMSTNINSPDIRSIMALLRITDEEQMTQDDPSVMAQPADMGMETPMESAEANDYGAELSSRKGGVYPGSDSRPGTARAPTVPTPAKSGDNPLAEMRGFKDYLQEVIAHQYPREGDMRPVNLGKYRADGSQGWGVSRFESTGYGSDWVIPAWDEEGKPDLAGPFADEHKAQAAIDAVWESREPVNEATGKGYRFSTCLSFGTDGEADYREIDVTISYNVAWGSPESGRFSGPPENYDPGSASEIEDIAVVELDGRTPDGSDKHAIDAILDDFASGKFDEDLLAAAADSEDARRPDDHRDREYDDRLEEDAVHYDSRYVSATGEYEIFNVATGEVVDRAHSGHECHNIIYALKHQKPVSEGDDWQARESRYGPSMILLPADQNVTFDTLDQTYFDEGSYVYVVGKEARAGYTPRYCISSGRLDYNNGEHVTIVHDQNRGLTPGQVMFQFSYDDWMNNREEVAQDLEAAGISRSRKVPVKVFK